MTTIITKNGSGAPTAGQLSEGELAVDLTNKELYTKSGSTVIKIGSQGGSSGTFTDLTATSSFTSPGINDNATSTAITIDASENVGIGQDAPSAPLTVDGPSNDTYVARFGNFAGGGGSIQGRTDIGLDFWATENGTHPAAAVGVEQVSTDQYRGGLLFSTRGTNSDVAPVERMRIDASGQVGIGTDNPSASLHVAETASGLTARFSNESNQTLDIGTVAGSGAAGSVYLDNANSGNMQFRIGGSERMRIDSSGNVGIGESNPSTTLDVSTNAGNGDAGQLVKVTNTNASSGTAKTLTIGTDNYFASNPGMTIVAESGLSFGVGDGSDLAAQRDLVITSSGDFLVGSGSRTYTVGSGTYEIDAAGGLNLSSGRDNGADMTFEVSNTERMRINASGSVGIGTDNPRRLLEVADTGAAIISLQSTNSDNCQIFFGDAASETAGKVVYRHSTNSMAFEVNSAEKMRIDSSGNLLVGRTTQVVGGKISVDYQNGVDAGIALKDTQTTGTGVPMQVVNGAGSVVGSITQDQSNTSFNTSSDERLKENIVDAPSGNIDGICVRSFDWKASGAHQTYGMIAQELVGVAPEAVTKETAGNDMWSIDYSKLVPMMIKEIQDLKAEVAALKGA